MRLHCKCDAAEAHCKCDAAEAHVYEAVRCPRQSCVRGALPRREELCLGVHATRAPRVSRSSRDLHVTAKKVDIPILTLDAKMVGLRVAVDCSFTLKL